MRLLQPLHGYRAALDPVFLAASVAAAPGSRILEAGCGTGAALLCLARRRPDLVLTGLEIQALPAALAAWSAERLGLAASVRVWEGDLARPPPELRLAFDAVFTNPPYLAAGRATTAPDPQRRLAHHEAEGLPLNAWIRACLARVRPGGHLHAIHRADRLDALLGALAGFAGDVTVFPLWPRQGQPAGRVIVRARKGARGPLRLLSGMVLHPDHASGYTPAAEAVLRHGAALDLDPPA
ncbi:tRNA1(Val) (adenine(37)-N6)-methyltransferase [Pararhodospirillum oryzae]|uniref:tRNA1(Val) (adenine(37)-N6)-methyltransferase n=1 Tax=Pararhodospirillum oryzae TaxID=478448 RepID=UPI0027D99A21|nr:methyltransferase domain-containing protein [Pararhodospirillum oryzae]